MTTAFDKDHMQSKPSGKHLTLLFSPSKMVIVMSVKVKKPKRRGTRSLIMFSEDSFEVLLKVLLESFLKDKLRETFVVMHLS